MKTIIQYLLACMVMLTSVAAEAQVCKNPKDTIYGLTSVAGISGRIIGINVIDTGTSFIGSAAAGSVNANGLGFSQVTGLYYFFNQTGGGTTEFISYNALTSAKVAKTTPPLLPTNQKIRSGCMTRDGTGYYTIYPGATTAQGYPLTDPAFYYYNVALNTWTLVTQTFKDISGNVVAPIQSLNSGDMAFDGNDNLWMLCSNSTQYALYKIKKANVPTTIVASVIVDTIIPVKNNPISGVSFTGLAFNSAGKLYLSTGSGAVAGTNLLYILPTAASTPTKIGTLPNSFGDDLTSCSFPVGVLAGSTWEDFTAKIQDNAVRLDWKAAEDDDVSSYEIEYSTNGSSWQTIGHVTSNNGGGENEYEFIHNGYNSSGSNYYRVVQVSTNDKRSYSDIRFISGRKDSRFYVGPNPAKDMIYFYNNDITSKQIAQIFDKSGRLVYSAAIDPSLQSISIASLSKGVYIIKLLTANGDEHTDGYQFIKW